MIRTVGVEETRLARAGLEGEVGFVPTMGALHRGHLSLVERALETCAHVVVSVFVNPTQFGPGEDLESYPRTLESDLELCRQAGVGLVWTPRVVDLYPPGSETAVTVEGLGSRFEGEARPGHFKGVATVVSKLFNVVSPQRAYFGRKDLQQLFVIKRMVADLLFPLEVVAVPTARAENGLALSSRNAYLTEQEREQAGVIHAALRRVRDEHGGGLDRPEALEGVYRELLQRLPGAELERFDLLRPDLSSSYQKGEPVKSGFCAVAVRYRGVRLIDNIELCC